MKRTPAASTWAERVLASIGAGVLVLDPMDEVIFANQRSAEILQRSPAELIGHGFSGLFPGQDAQLDEDGRLEFESTLPNGQLAMIGGTLTAVPPSSGDEAEEEDATELSRIFMFQDITEIYRLRAERDRLLQISALNSVLPSVLHELRNPIAAIATSLEVLLEECDSPFRDDLSSILAEVQRMSLNLRGVGVVGRALCTQRRSAIDDTLRALVRVVEAQANKKGVLIDAQICDFAPLPFDQSVVQAIAFNLLHNAIAASRPGGVVSIRASLLYDALFELTITDRGTGMSKATAAKATNLFFTTKDRGSGIGLALVKRSVEGAGGTLSIDSTLGRGTQVTVTLPTKGPRSRTRRPRSSNQQGPIDSPSPTTRKEHPCHESNT